MSHLPEPDLSAKIHEFRLEAFGYCQGLSDNLAREYAVEYSKALEDRAKGLDTSPPKAPFGLFAPNRNLIRATLDRLCARHLSGK